MFIDILTLKNKFKASCFLSFDFYVYFYDLSNLRFCQYTNRLSEKCLYKESYGSATFCNKKQLTKNVFRNRCLTVADFTFSKVPDWNLLFSIVAESLFI